MATENILIKFTSDTSGIKTSIDELQKMGKVTEEDAKKLQMLEGIAEGVADALKEAGIEGKNLNKAVTDTATSGKTLRTQFSEARNEAVKLSQQFGAFSKEAREAAKRAAELKDQIGDMNDVLDALNPEAKLNAFVNLGQGVQGAFQAATGALQVFGVENERITKLAQQFQGVLNLTQGINSVLQLKDVYTQLRLVLGVTTTAQKGLNTAMLASPVGILLVSVAALGAALYAFSDDTDEATESQEEFKEATKDTNEELERQFKNITALDDLNRRGAQSAESVVVRIKAGTNLLAFSTKELNNALSDLKEKYDELTPENIVLFDPNGVKTQQDLTNEYNIQKKELENLIGTIEKYLKKKSDVKKIEEDIIKLMRELTIQVIRNNKEVLNLSDEGFERLKDTLRITEANAFDVRDAIQEINKELGNLEVFSTKVTTTATDLNKELFDKKDERARESSELAKELALESASFISTLNRASAQQQINDLEDQKEKGIITEEQYQSKIKKIKTEAAKRDKELAIFSATILFAEALINALTFKPANAVPSALILASVTAGLNLAKIIATPIPKFKAGTLNVGGGNIDSDGGMHAVIHRGEAVIPADRNRDYHPTIRAMFNRQIKPSDINSFVQMKLQGRIPNKIDARINSKELARAIGGSDSVTLKNGGLLAKQIGREIAGHYNPRRR